MFRSTKEAQTGKYTTTLFGCFNDIGICCFTWFFYPCAEAMTWASARDEKCTCCHFRLFGNGMFIRENVKVARAIEPNYCKDCLVYSFCWNCALAQDWREIKLIKAQNMEELLKPNQEETVILTSTLLIDNNNENEYP